MRVLFLTNFYPPYELGGQGRSCNQVVQALKERGHTTRVVTSMHGINNKPVCDDEICRCLYLEMDLTPLLHSINFFTQRKKREQHNLKSLKAQIRLFEPDIIFIWGMWNFSRNIPVLAEALMPGRVVYRFAEYWPTLPSQHEFYWRAPAQTWYNRLLKGLLKPLALAMLSKEEQPAKLSFANVISVSAATRDLLIEKGIPLNHAKVIHTGLEVEPYLNEKRPPNLKTKQAMELLYVGRISADKGIETAIKAVGHLVYVHGLNDVQFRLAGSGSENYMAYLQQVVIDKGLEDCVKFLGWVPHEEMIRLMTRFDVLIVPSEWPEPFARVVLEGMVSGLAVVATPNGGTAEIVRDGENGLLFETGNSQDLAQKLADLSTDKSLLEKLQKNGRETVLANFTLGKMIDNYESYLMDVATGDPQWNNKYTL